MSYVLRKSREIYPGRNYRWIYSAVYTENGNIRISGIIGSRTYIFHSKKSAVTAYNAEVKANRTWKRKG